jgi:hypothetical protein
MVTDFMTRNLPGITGQDDTIKEKIRLEVSRVAREHNHLDSIHSIDIERDDERANAFKVTIQYVAGDSFVFKTEE